MNTVFREKFGHKKPSRLKKWLGFLISGNVSSCGNVAEGRFASKETTLFAISHWGKRVRLTFNYFFDSNSLINASISAISLRCVEMIPSANLRTRGSLILARSLVKIAIE